MEINTMCALNDNVSLRKFHNKYLLIGKGSDNETVYCNILYNFDFFGCFEQSCESSARFVHLLSL